ncbi:unnamed protein product [Trichobilharzia regenti]|nr:unnamed protein product [Trichobilharzia regenti]
MRSAPFPVYLSVQCGSPHNSRSYVTSALEAYKELRPKFEDFIHNDGTTRKLVSLDGTIPVRYMGSTYNIPIAIFLFEVYPNKSPMVYVRPTNTMQIKPSDFVDSAGLVQLPYMTDWKHVKVSYSRDLACTRF